MYVTYFWENNLHYPNIKKFIWNCKLTFDTYIIIILVVRNKWFDRYGRKNGFIVYCLRYFLLLNWRRNLFIQQQEFLALCALVFVRAREEHYQQIQLRPTPRGVSIGNWFLVSTFYAFICIYNIEPESFSHCCVHTKNNPQKWTRVGSRWTLL